MMSAHLLKHVFREIVLTLVQQTIPAVKLHHVLYLITRQFVIALLAQQEILSLDVKPVSTWNTTKTSNFKLLKLI